jgi:hypothetical protein
MFTPVTPARNIFLRLEKSAFSRIRFYRVIFSVKIAEFPETGITRKFSASAPTDACNNRIKIEDLGIEHGRAALWKARFTAFRLTRLRSARSGRIFSESLREPRPQSIKTPIVPD